MSDAQGKTCKRCTKHLPLSLFGINRATPDGLKYWCKPCSDDYFREWVAKNPEKVKARAQRSYQNNKAQHYARNRAYALANKERAKAYSAEWRARNPEKRRQVCQEWATRNREYLNMQSANRRAAKMRATPAWTDSEFEQLVKAEAYNLAQLRSAATGIKYSVDHIVPLQSEKVCGLHCAANFAVIPLVVNKSKNNRHWPDMP